MRSPLRKASELQELLRQLLLSEHLLGKVSTIWAEGEPVFVDGLTLLYRHGPHHPLDWLKEPELDEQDLTQVYEEIVDRRGLPGRRKSFWAQSLLDQVGFGDFFTEARRDDEWYEPLALVMGLVSSVTGDNLLIGNGGMELVTEEYRYQISASHVWSNTRGALEKARRKSPTLSTPTLWVDGLITDHPLARALVALQAPKYVMWLVRVWLLRDDMPRTFDEVFKGLPGPPTRLGRPRGAAQKTVDEAPLHQALEAVRMNNRGVAQEVALLLSQAGFSSRRVDAILGKACRTRELPLVKTARDRVYSAIATAGENFAK